MISASTPVRVLARSFTFIERAHRGSNRLRPNADGSARSYVHHPMEVALLFAEMELFERRKKRGELSSHIVAEKIVEVVERNSQMDKRQLKRRLRDVCARLNGEQLIIVVGLLSHDTIESTYTKRTDEEVKQCRTIERKAEIAQLCQGSEDVALELTDPKHYKNKYEKQDGQLKLATQYRYASLKKYDVLTNMFDEPLIPSKKRNRKKKRAQITHMRHIMMVAYRSGHITLGYLKASERIYERAMAQLG